MAKMTSKSSSRVEEIDLLRGLALCLMIVFHLLFDLNEIFGYPVQYNSGAYYLIGKLSAVMFIMISAISCSFSRSNVRRALKFAVVAAMITFATYLYNRDLVVVFGIIHFLTLSILLYPLFRNMDKYLLIALGTIIIIVGQYLGMLTAGNNLLFLFNYTDIYWASSDYYPLFPWFGVFLYGVSVGKFLYQERRSLIGPVSEKNILAYLGRHTLVIYLIHQPVLIILIGVIRKIAG